ncbi:MAG: hypothetical protein AAF681_07370 [Pseudomonadota bacterium]
MGERVTYRVSSPVQLDNVPGGLRGQPQNLSVAGAEYRSETGLRFNAPMTLSLPLNSATRSFGDGQVARSSVSSQITALCYAQLISTLSAANFERVNRDKPGMWRYRFPFLS